MRKAQQIHWCGEFSDRNDEVVTGHRVFSGVHFRALSQTELAMTVTIPCSWRPPEYILVRYRMNPQG
jgi:hypothetical protein